MVLNYILVGCPCRNYREQIQQAVRARLELKPSKLQVQRFNRSATLPESFSGVTIKSVSQIANQAKYLARISLNVFTWGNAQSLWVPFVTK